MAKQSYIATPEGQLAVREAITYQGLTQQQLATAANLRTRSSVSKLINGKPVDRQIFQRICRCLELDFRAIAGLQLSTAVNEVQSAPTPSSESSTNSMEWVLSELNTLKVALQSLMSVPSTLEALNVHVQTLGRSPAQNSELLDPQPARRIKAPRIQTTSRESVPGESLIRKELDTPLEKVKATFLTPPEIQKIDEQVESRSDENVLGLQGLLSPGDSFKLSPAIEQSAQEDLSNSDDKQPAQVPELPSLSPANPVSFNSKEPLKRPDSLTTASEKQSSKPPQENKPLAWWWERFGGK